METKQRFSWLISMTVAIGMICSLVFLPTLLTAKEQDTITWAGCGITKKSFMAEVAVAFEKKTGVTIKLEGGGATRGIRDAAAGKIHLGGSCRMTLPLHDPSELHVTLHPVAWDALAVILHKDNPVKNISSEQIRLIYRGKIKNWKQLGGVDAPIHLYVRKGMISGVGYAIRQYVFQDSRVDFVTNKKYVVKSSGPLEKAVEKDPHAMGITGVSSARKRNVKLVGIDGFVPSYDNIRDGNYIFYRPLYLVTGSSPSDSVKTFIEFVQSAEGSQIIRDNGTVPYMDAVHLMTKTLIYGFNVK